MSDLAVIVRRGQTGSTNAIRLDEEVLKLRKAKLGIRGPRATLSLVEQPRRRLGSYMAPAGTTTPIRLGKEVLKLRKDQIGARRNRDTLQSMNATLAKFYYDAGRNAEALPLFEEVAQTP